MDKSFAVFGLGKFGRSVAKELANAGADVLAIDNDKERVHALADIVTCAVAVDIRDTEAMESLGISNMAAVVVAVTRSLAASILATLSETIKMLEINIKPEWAGCTLRELDLRGREHINVIAIRKDGELIVNPDPDITLTPDLSMLITVEKKYLHRLIK